MHYLYRITNQLNGKIYIGQTVDDKKRWSAHKSFAKNPEKTGQYIHRAMAKYGIDNFTFETIATCKTQEDVDDTESILIKQYDSRNQEKGYNLVSGGGGVGSGINHPLYGKKQSQETINKRIEKVKGQKRTPEQLQKMSQLRLANPVDYTPEIRQHMSEAHIGIKDSEETKQNKSISAKEAWEKRIDYSRKCSAPGCEVSGKAKYKIINGSRYCNKHGLRLLRYNRLDSLSD